MLFTEPVYTTCDLARILGSPANGFEYLPLRDLSLCLDHALFGDWPGGFHLTNVALFALASVLVLAVHRAIFAHAPPSALRVAAAHLGLLSALVFVVHPLQVEPVAFVTGRNALLALLFTLAALATYGHFLRSGSRMAHGTSVLFVAAAALSKVTALPAALLLLLAHLYLRREDRFVAGLRSVSPHLVVTAGLAVLHLFVAARAALAAPVSLGSVLTRLPRAAFVSEFYLAKFFWPLHLSTEYVLDDVREHWMGLAVITLLLAAAGGAIVVRGLRPRSPACMLLLAYLAALAPVLNILPTIPTVADRYAQIPIVFVVPLTVYALARWLPPRALLGVGAAAICALSLLSHRQLGVWESEEKLFSHAVALDSRAAGSLERLAYTRWRDGRKPGAVDAFRRLSELDAREERHLAYGALLALEAGRIDEADALAERARGKRRQNHLLFVMLGVYWEQRGRVARAHDYYERARRDARVAARRDPNAREIVDFVDRKLPTGRPGT